MRRGARAQRTSDGAVGSLESLDRDVVACRACPRHVAHCSEVARTRRRAYSAEEYWGRPVPGFGDPRARMWILGLAPGAHGANRTGRVFTGDRSGDFLFAALFRAGLANQPHARSRDDGLVLRDAYISAAARCAPPGNKPTPDELGRCSAFLARESRLLARASVLVCLGGIAWDAALRLAESEGSALPRPRPRFAHGAELDTGSRTLIACYHVSQQNTFTGRLTEAMIDRVVARARELAGNA
jgi:uracil-DNA glycosylase